MDEQPWNKTKLSLEAPYKNDRGDFIPVLLDITPGGEHIYETKVESSNYLGERLRRIFLERGLDFFETGLSVDGELKDNDVENASDLPSEKQGLTQDLSNQVMTPAELYKMRMEIMPQLDVALGEMGLARELLSALSSADPSSASSNAVISLTSTPVTKLPQIPSIHTFNTLLSIGGKDEALRKAAALFKSAAESMERGRVKGEKYWVDALKIRRSNWGLIPAPLPYGSTTGKGADKSSKDFLVSYGLEASPHVFRRQAVGRMPTYDVSSDILVFPYEQRTRLRITLSTSYDQRGQLLASNSAFIADNFTLDGLLIAAQKEVIEREIFSVLVREAGSLSTASARVSERLIVIEAAHGLQLQCELVASSVAESERIHGVTSGKCDLIYSILHMLLLRIHKHHKVQRLGGSGTVRVDGLNSASPPLMLQPIIDVLQYQLFCEKVKAEMGMASHALGQVGVPSTFRFVGVGESGLELVKLLDEDNERMIGGEAVLRVAERHTLRLTFASPSSLTAHLSQTTLVVTSIPQLRQLLFNEMERYLLSTICDLGRSLCKDVNGTWFVDQVKSGSVGRWEGHVINFQIFFEGGYEIHSSASSLGRDANKEGTSLETSILKRDASLLDWAKEIINAAL